MGIYKLNYPDKETAIYDLIAKGVYVETTFKDKTLLTYGKGIQAVVEIGKIVSINGTYDADFKELTAPVYFDGYAYDIMSEQEIDFKSEVFPKNSKHGFSGNK